MSQSTANRMSSIASASDLADLEVSVVLPCLNEAETVGTCVTAALQSLKRMRVAGEVVVVDNGSEDGSAEIARRAGARVVYEPRRGYGHALRRGIAEARGHFIIMADADASYDLSDLRSFRGGIARGR